MLWDIHMHSDFSGDSNSTPQSMIQAAIKKGLSGICFTDHLDYDYPQNPDEFLLDLETYSQTIHQLQGTYADQLPIRYGIELGLQPHLAQKHSKLVQDMDFDFVIGSSHVVHGQDPYFPQYYEEKTEDEAYLEYFESILENIYAFDALPNGCCFDVYGHIDYVVRYGPNKNTYYSYTKFQDVIDEILKQLIARGKGIEINTAGFKYGLGHPNPCEDIIKRYRKLGGEIITTGADGHQPEHIAYRFDLLPQLLKSCGFSYYTIFQKRKPQFIPIL